MTRGGEALPPSSRARRRQLAGFLYLALALFPRGASATLAGDMRSIAGAWSRSGRVELLKARLMSRAERLPLPLPAWSTQPSASRCTNLAILTSTSISFAVHLTGVSAEPESSQVGWVLVTRCGPERRELQQSWVEMRSPRGVVEVIVADSLGPLPSPGALLAHRDPGPASALGDAGDVPTSPPIEQRATAWHRRARSEGAARVGRVMVRADARRHLTSTTLELSEGCHRFSALALQTTEQSAPPDLDLVVRGRAGADVMRGEQSENSDAELDVCVGASTPVEVLVPGLGPGEPSLLQHAEFPLPTGLPARWGPGARARFAGAFFRRHQAGPSRDPVIEALGLGGRTPLPLELEARTCYVAGVAVVQGKLKSLLLDAVVPDGEGATDGTTDESSLALAFCTGDQLRAQLRVEANGASIVWLAAVWRAGSAPREEP